MTTAFDATAPENNPAQNIDKPGRHVVEAVEAFRLNTKGGDAIVVRAESLLGECKGKRVSRLLMIEGKGTRWLANLLQAVNNPQIEDIQSDAEVSKALTRAPFAVTCAWGRVVVDDNKEPRLDEHNNKIRYMEVREIYPITQRERETLQGAKWHPADRIDLFIEQGEGQQSTDYPPGEASGDAEDGLPF